LTAARSATIVAGAYSEVITQAGIDNTYVYSIDPNHIDINHLSGKIPIKVYANVSGSVLATKSNSSWISILFSDDRLTLAVPQDDPQYGNRAFYRSGEVRINSNYSHDAVTGLRNGSFLIGASGNPQDTFTVTQSGVDNTYLYSIDPRHIETTHQSGTVALKVYANVSASSIDTQSNSSWISLFFNDGQVNIAVPASDPQYGIRAFYRGFEVRISNNSSSNAITEARTGSFQTGSPGNLSTTFTVAQSGIEQHLPVSSRFQ